MTTSARTRWGLVLALITTGAGCVFRPIWSPDTERRDRVDGTPGGDAAAADASARDVPTSQDAPLAPPTADAAECGTAIAHDPADGTSGDGSSDGTADDAPDAGSDGAVEASLGGA